jgi:SAM-dependent methyltransferase
MPNRRDEPCPPFAKIARVSVPPEIFDDDYLYFYTDVLSAERSDADADLVARLLSLRPGVRVLDVPCGEGRIAGRLARRGCEVVGIDANEHFLSLARERYPEATFQHGDMRNLQYESEFDAVVNWFTSFGYFDPATNDKVLAGLARALRPDGRLLLELHNPGRLARLVELAGGSSATVVERGRDLMVDRVRYDQAAGRSRTERFIVKNGRVRKLEFSLEQVPAPQLTRRLHQAGFRDVQLFGQDGAPFEPEGRRLIALARR